MTEQDLKTINIAIDGPAGAGKSTLSKLLASRLGFLYIDTGALYRAIGLMALRSNIPASDDKCLRSLLGSIKIEIRFKNGGQHVYVNGEDVSTQIRSPEVSMAASAYSAVPQVRTFLLGLQKDMAARNNVVMDGRDIGTVVLPNADLKIFLTASAQDRANRRYTEMIQRGDTADYAQVLEDMIKRDAADSEREIAPLKQADDAVLLDTTGFTLEASLDALLALVRSKLSLT